MQLMNVSERGGGGEIAGLCRFPPSRPFGQAQESGSEKVSLIVNGDGEVGLSGRFSTRFR